MKDSLIGLFPEEISQRLDGQPKFRANQIYQHISTGKMSFSEMNNLPLQLRDSLESNFSLYTTEVEQVQTSVDGTAKYLLKLHDGNYIEVVVLQDGDRLTACLSTQVGCAMGCTFCKTAELGLIRNLSSSEIVQEFLILKQYHDKISNIVFMGMGEPLANFINLVKAIKILTDEKGINLGRRKITISTCGLVKEMIDFAKVLPQVKLAVSLNSAIDENRSKIMPINKKYNLEKLRDGIIEFNKITGKRLTAEYVLLKNENDSEKDIAALVKFARDLNLLINIIPWNSKDNSSHKSPSNNDVTSFITRLESHGLKVTKRASKGQDIDGACGQLAAKSQ